MFSGENMNVYETERSDHQIRENDCLIDPVTGNIVDQTSGQIVHVPTSERVENPKVVITQRRNIPNETESVHSGTRKYISS